MEKLETLKSIIAEYKSVVIAFSGGVDSAFLAHVAGEVLPNNILLVTVTSLLYPAFELNEAKRIAVSMKVNHRIFTLAEDDIIDRPEFSNNLPDRCYYCKKLFFTRIKDLTAAEKYDGIFEGGNVDDLKDYRPGKRALEELSIRSPLGEAGLTKAEIRNLSQKLGLPTAQRPSSPCLATRFPYGEGITKAKLKRVEQAENALRTMGFIQFRIRSHGNVARIELGQEEMEAGWAKRVFIRDVCKKAGFIYVAIDTGGYRTGSMNEGLPIFAGRPKISLAK